MLPDAGDRVNHEGPPNEGVPVNVTGELESVVSVNDWLAAVVNSSPEGWTMLPVPDPGVRTLSTTVTDCGELGAPGAWMATWP